MIRRALVAVVVTAAGTAAAEPLAIELPEQAPPLGPSHLRIALDAAFASGQPTTASSTTLVASARGRRGRWMLSAELGLLAWRDRSIVVGVREVRGLSLTNAVLGATRWTARHRHARGYVRLVLALPTTNGLRYEPEVFEYARTIYAPSQYVRAGAVPTGGPDLVPKAALGLRVEPGPAVVQVEGGFEPLFAWFAAGVAVQVSPALALTGHAIVRHDLAADPVKVEPDDSAIAIGGGVVARGGPGLLSLRGDYRLDHCRLGDWAEGAAGDRCTRVVLAYAIPFR